MVKSNSWSFFVAANMDSLNPMKKEINHVKKLNVKGINEDLYYDILVVNLLAQPPYYTRENAILFILMPFLKTYPHIIN